MRQGIGLGVGINRSNYAQGIFNAYSARVVADGGVVESGTCVDAVSSLLQSASLLLIPSGYKANKLYAEIPTNGNGDLTWTRGGDAFRTNASGLLQRVPWNLLQQSETFSNATWTKNATTITADTILAPNGTLTADKLVETATSSTHWVFQSTTYTSTSQTVSCYMKKGERNFGFIRTRTATTDLFAWFNLNTGALGTVESGITASITNVGDGWYRCVVVNPNPTTSANPSVIGLSNADNVSTYTGDGTSGIYIWGAQLVEGTTAQTYLPTTDRLNFPRLDYTYGSCPSALLEPQRTNLCLYSQDFTSFSDKGTTITITANTTTAPDGTLTADTITANGTGTLLVRQLVYGGTTQPCSNSIFAKKANHRYIGLRNNGSTSAHDVFDFDTKTWTNNSGSILSYDELPNGWFRLKSTNNLGVANYYLSVIPALNTSGAESATVSNLSIYVWGAQAEQNANYVSTYIPTTTATATRVADSFSRNNIYTNGLISASGGTWFVELRGNIVYTRDNAVNGLFLGSDSIGTTNSFLINAVGGGGRLRINKIVSGVFSQLYLTATDTTKIAIKWNGTSADVFVNGTKQVSATTFTVTQLEFLAHSSTSGDVPKFIQQMALFPTPLSDTDCTTLTT